MTAFSTVGLDRSLPARWKAREVTLGAWCMMPGALGVEIVGGQGFDWLAMFSDEHARHTQPLEPGLPILVACDIVAVLDSATLSEATPR